MEPQRIATCVDCGMFQSLPKGDTGECRYEPPKVHFLPMQSMQGTNLVPVSIFPQVVKDAWCGCFAEKVDAEEATVIET